MNISDFSYYIFDMDGTLVDSEPIGPDTFVQVFSERGHQPNQEEITTFTQSWRRIDDYIPQDKYMVSLANKYKIDESIVESFYTAYIDNLLKAEPLDGVDDFLKKSKQKGKKLIVVSASTHEQILTILNNNKWTEYFNFTVGAEDVKTHKPDPEGYNFAIQKLGVNPTDIVIFEDSKNGVTAAKLAGSYTVGVRAGNRVEVDLTKADKVIQSFAEII